MDIRRIGVRSAAGRAVAASCAAALGAALGACGGSAPGHRWVGEVRDSAGIAIVENRGGALWDSARTWRIREDLVVAADESRPETLFGQVADVAADAAGRIYVLDAYAQEVRVFGPDGRHLRTLGGPGEGPGELGRFATSVLVVDSTLLVTDWSLRRVNRYALDGTVLASWPLPGKPGARTWWQPDREGGVLIRSLARYVDEAGKWRGEDRLLRLAPGDTAADVVLTFEYPESDLGGPDAIQVPLLLNAPSWTPLDSGRIAWTSLDRERVHVVGPDGRLERILARDAWRRRPLEDGDHARLLVLLGEKLAMLGGNPDVVAQLDVVRDDELPAITGVLAGPEGTLWVQRMGDVAAAYPMAINGPDHPEWLGGGEWDVLDRDGRFLGTVSLPPRFRPMDVAGDTIYGVDRDELDVERVVRLALERPDGT